MYPEGREDVSKKAHIVCWALYSVLSSQSDCFLGFCFSCNRSQDEFYHMTKPGFKTSEEKRALGFLTPSSSLAKRQIGARAPRLVCGLIMHSLEDLVSPYGSVFLHNKHDKA